MFHKEWNKDWENNKYGIIGSFQGKWSIKQSFPSSSALICALCLFLFYLCFFIVLLIPPKQVIVAEYMVYQLDVHAPAEEVGCHQDTLLEIFELLVPKPQQY